MHRQTSQTLLASMWLLATLPSVHTVHTPLCPCFRPKALSGSSTPRSLSTASASGTARWHRPARWRNQRAQQRLRVRLRRWGDAVAPGTRTEELDLQGGRRLRWMEVKLAGLWRIWEALRCFWRFGRGVLWVTLMGLWSFSS